MNRLITSTAIPARELKIEALASISASFERLCLAAGLEALGEMMEADAQTACGPRHGRGKDRTAHRWGKTKGKIGFHGGKVEIARPRLRSFDGKEQALPSWEGAMTEDWLGKWAMNQMLINVSTRKFERSMRLPEGDVPAPNGSGLSKSAASRRFVALSAARLKEWMGSDLSDLGLLVIQIDGIHMDEDMTLVAAIGVDVNGDKHPLGLVEGATENAATVQALIDNLVERGLDPAVPRLFIIDGSKALSKAIRATFGRDAAIQRCQIHKARNIMDRLPKSMHAQVRRVLRQAWEMTAADQIVRSAKIVLAMEGRPHMGRQHVRVGFLQVRQAKTGAILEIPLHPALQEILAAHPAEHLTFLTTQAGQPFTAAGFTGWFRDRCKEAGLPLGLSAHGLRKATCRRLAEAGCSASQIAAISGHRTLKEVQRYVAAADQKRMAVDAVAAMPLWTKDKQQVANLEERLAKNRDK